MAVHIRIVLLLSLLIVIGLSVTGGMFLRERAVEDLVRIVDKNNTSIAQGYVNIVWKRHRDIILPLLANPAQLKDNPQVIAYAQDTLRYFHLMPLIKVNIYSASGQLLMTSNINPANKLLGTTASPDPAYVTSQSQRGGANSQVLKDITMQGIQHGKLVQTILPIYVKADGALTPPPEGAVEVLYDITDQWDRLESVQNFGIGIVIGIFLFFVAILVLMSRKAENIIAKQHEANLELTAAAAAAQAENQEKSQFLANISHELRTPLNAIIGFSDILKKEMMPQIEEKKYHDYVNDINASGVHLLSLINDILDYSKAEAGKLALEISEVNTTKLIQNCMRLVSPRAEAANVRLLEQLPKDPMIMMTDGKKLKQVLLNLLSNAVKFTPAGGQVLVTAWQNIADDTYAFEVEDTGIGIAPKDISRAMAPFGQVDNTLKRKYEGTGLGLPLTKKFVELMGGKFKIESELNKGTKINFVLPREFTPQEGGVEVKKAS